MTTILSQLTEMRVSQALYNRPSMAEIGAWFAQYIDGVTMSRTLAAPRRWRGRFIRRTQLVATMTGQELSTFIFDPDKGAP